MSRNDKPQGEKAQGGEAAATSWRDQISSFQQSIISTLESRKQALEADDERIASQQAELQSQREAVQSELQTVNEELDFHRLTPADLQKLRSESAAPAEVAPVQPIEQVQPEAPGKLSDLHGAEPNNLDEYCLIVLNNAVEPVNMESLQSAILEAGYSTKSAGFKSVLYAATKRLKDAKKAKSERTTGRTVNWSLTSLGKKAAAALLKEEGPPAAVPQASDNMEQHVLKFMKSQKGQVRAMEAVGAILASGYKPKEPNSFGEAVAAAFDRLAANNLVAQVGKQGAHRLWALTPAGIEEPVSI